jgi:Flp pilus assembly protein TadG
MSGEAALDRRHDLGRDGMLSLEAVLVLPVLALLVLGLFQVAAVARDVLLLHEAARAGVRVAATTTGTDAPTRAARAAAPELGGLQVSVEPRTRRAGDLVTVHVSSVRRLGPVSHRLAARAVAHVEPSVGGWGW